VLSKDKLGILEVETGGRVVLVKGSLDEVSLDGVMLAEEPEEQ
jgi:hypothetical protein